MLTLKVQFWSGYNKTFKHNLLFPLAAYSQPSLLLFVSLSCLKQKTGLGSENLLERLHQQRHASLYHRWDDSPHSYRPSYYQILLQEAASADPSKTSGPPATTCCCLLISLRPGFFPECFPHWQNKSDLPLFCKEQHYNCCCYSWQHCYTPTLCWKISEHTEY